MRKTENKIRAVELVAKPTIEFPQEAAVVGPFYAVRVSAPGALAVHVAVDQGDWKECREALGYWWFDWQPETEGEHELVACALTVGGREAVSEAVHCFKK